MLVAAFGGYKNVMAAYQHAVAEHYRFSFGDVPCLSLRMNPLICLKTKLKFENILFYLISIIF